MSRYALLVLSLCLFFLAAFLVAMALDVQLFTGTDWMRDHARWSAVVILNLLLVVNAVLFAIVAIRRAATGRTFTYPMTIGRN